MMEYKKTGRLKIISRNPMGGKVEITQCENCNGIARSPGPGQPYKCRCGWTMARSKIKATAGGK